MSWRLRGEEKTPPGTWEDNPVEECIFFQEKKEKKFNKKKHLLARGMSEGALQLVC